jgi:hypothetical protein
LSTETQVFNACGSSLAHVSLLGAARSARASSTLANLCKSSVLCVPCGLLIWPSFDVSPT